MPARAHGHSIDHEGSGSPERNATVNSTTSPAASPTSPLFRRDNDPQDYIEQKTGYTAGKILHLRRHEPEAYDRARTLFVVHNYVNWYLTGGREGGVAALEPGDRVLELQLAFLQASQLELIDGGLLNPVPVAVARSLAPSLPVVAVALNPPLGEPPHARSLPWLKSLPPALILSTSPAGSSPKRRRISAAFPTG